MNITNPAMAKIIIRIDSQGVLIIRDGIATYYLTSGEPS